MKEDSLTLEFIDKAKKIHGERYVYSKVKYCKSKIKVIITCRIHGDYEQSPNSHLAGYGCLECGKINGSRKRTKIDTETFVEKAKKVHGEEYLYSDVKYIHHREDVQITCRIHGKFPQRPDRHLSGQGCPHCANENRTNGNRLGGEEFVKRSIEIHNGFYEYSDVKYLNSYTPVSIRCPLHGVFEQTPKNHLVGKGCLKCKESKGERAVSIFLDKHKLNYIREFSFTDSLYRYDFFLPDENILIEFHGEQHYLPVKHFNGEQGLADTKKRDSRKIELSELNKIPLIVVNYQHLNSGTLERTLVRALKQINRYWFKTSDGIKTFKYSDEVSKYFNVKGSPISRITESNVLREKYGIDLLFTNY